MIWDFKKSVFDNLCPSGAPEKEPRKFSESEAEMLADWFHNDEHCPDIDGYIGTFILPEEVMIIYRKKFSKQRKWE